MISIRSLLAVAAMSAAVAGSAAAAFAQAYPPPGPPPPPPNAWAFERWQAAWDQWQFDRHHIVVATVSAFSPYRLQVQRRDGALQTIDLKPGTVIRPLGATPQPGQRVAAIGYWSQGTFIANRIVLRY